VAQPNEHAVSAATPCTRRSSGAHALGERVAGLRRPKLDGLFERTQDVNARIAALACASLFACRSASTPVPEARADEPPGVAASGVAVVELFTSEGCSSCPAADDVLGDLARRTDRPIYALGFHVDYWDNLGWPDRAASPDNTARQRAYAYAFGVGGLYTPQMIVDGTEPFTGSDRARADVAVGRALTRPASVRLSIHPRRTGSHAVTVDYETQGAPAGSVLSVAIVEREVSTSVRAGENAGKTLRHANVVRAFISAPLASTTGSVVEQLSASVPRDATEVIAFVQRPSADGGMPVLGATRSSVARM
jgi:hypothetical protein